MNKSEYIRTLKLNTQFIDEMPEEEFDKMEIIRLKVNNELKSKNNEFHNGLEIIIIRTDLIEVYND